MRLCALQTIVESPKTTEEIIEWEILYLLSFFSYNVSSQSASFRKKVASLYKKLLARFQASNYVITRDITSLTNLLKKEPHHQPSKDKLQRCEHVKKYYRGFLVQFINVLLTNLCSDANYSRRALSLELLLLLHQVATETEWNRSFSNDHVLNLKYLLHDSYESNKQMALEVLKTLPPVVLGFKVSYKKCR